MRGTFNYGVEIKGLGEIFGEYTVENGHIDSIDLPDGETVEFTLTGEPQHEDQFFQVLGKLVYAELRSTIDEKMDELWEDRALGDADRKYDDMRSSF